MLETSELERTKASGTENETLDELIPAIRQLNAHDKLILIRILAEDLTKENSLIESVSPGLYDFQTPYEIEGVTDEMIDRFESLPKPITPQDAS